MQESHKTRDAYDLPYRRLVVLVLCILFVACEAKPPPGSTGLQDVHQPVFTSAGVNACHYCHAGEFNRSVAASPHGDVTNAATPYGQNGCESCHGPGSFHISRAFGGQGRPGLINFGSGAGASLREVQLGACESCHHAEAAEPERIGFRGSAHDSSYINCSTCHTMHVQDEALSNPVHQASICLDCHRSMMSGHPEVRGRTVDFEREACSNCHDMHPVAQEDEDVFDF